MTGPDGAQGLASPGAREGNLGRSQGRFAASRTCSKRSCLVSCSTTAPRVKGLATVVHQFRRRSASIASEPPAMLLRNPSATERAAFAASRTTISASVASKVAMTSSDHGEVHRQVGWREDISKRPGISRGRRGRSSAEKKEQSGERLRPNGSDHGEKRPCSRSIRCASPVMSSDCQHHTRSDQPGKSAKGAVEDLQVESPAPSFSVGRRCTRRGRPRPRSRGTREPARECTARSWPGALREGLRGE